ncbi:hypothetical protein CBR_g21043 [Chara braunii]|uniref:ERCC4 domain-containing protein n=1 Tax=Chara braunii TaxID=69332 RepID=A0A388L0G5_CHABU|nr:hypothetical protein CBR_g21043 [Chara braunii]|eukprot:GBG75797.1 hypothetical protein CBR_g21043 [Chara braunii]
MVGRGVQTPICLDSSDSDGDDDCRRRRPAAALAHVELRGAQWRRASPARVEDVDRFRTGRSQPSCAGSVKRGGHVSFAERNSKDGVIEVEEEMEVKEPGDDEDSEEQGDDELCSIRLEGEDGGGLRPGAAAADTWQNDMRSRATASAISPRIGDNGFGAAIRGATTRVQNRPEDGNTSTGRRVGEAMRVVELEDDDDGAILRPCGLLNSNVPRVTVAGRLSEQRVGGRGAAQEAEDTTIRGATRGRPRRSGAAAALFEREGLPAGGNDAGGDDCAQEGLEVRRRTVRSESMMERGAQRDGREEDLSDRDRDGTHDREYRLDREKEWNTSTDFYESLGEREGYPRGPLGTAREEDGCSRSLVKETEKGPFAGQEQQMLEEDDWDRLDPTDQGLDCIGDDADDGEDDDDDDDDVVEVIGDGGQKVRCVGDRGIDDGGRFDDDCGDCSPCVGDGLLVMDFSAMAEGNRGLGDGGRIELQGHVGEDTRPSYLAMAVTDLEKDDDEELGDGGGKERAGRWGASEKDPDERERVGCTEEGEEEEEEEDGKHGRRGRGVCRGRVAGDGGRGRGREGGKGGAKRGNEERRLAMEAEKLRKAEEKKRKVEEMARAKEEKKRKREEEQRRKIEAKAQQAQQKMLEKELRKWEKGSDAEKRIRALIDMRVMERAISAEVVRCFHERGYTYSLSSNPIKDSILWRIKCPALGNQGEGGLADISSQGDALESDSQCQRAQFSGSFMDKDDVSASQQLNASQSQSQNQQGNSSQRLCIQEVDVGYVMIVLEAEVFVQLVEEGKLDGHVRQVQSQHAGYMVCYLINKLWHYVNARCQAQYKNANGNGQRREGATQSAEAKQLVHQALARLSTSFSQVHHRVTVDVSEAADHIAHLTKMLAKCMYRPQQTFLSVNSGGMHMNANQRFEHRNNAWIRALCAIPSMSGAAAVAIARKFPTMRSLLTEYMNPRKSQYEKELLLQDFLKESGPGEGVRPDCVSSRRLGPTLSRKVYRLFVATNPRLFMEDVAMGADMFSDP